MASSWSKEDRSTPVAVIDIGSNSVRLVIYDGPARAPFPICNEKALCGLGRNRTADGDLDAAAMDYAFGTLARFSRILEDFGDPPVCVIATAAVREARNGTEFVQRAASLGFNIEIIDGAREAELAALGVVSSEPDAKGLVGDMGGGSLELVGVNGDRLGPADSLSLGPLRLIEQTGGSLGASQKIVNKALDGLDWINGGKYKTLYAVGGAWRALAKIHMQLRQHPLSVLHHYDLTAKEIIDVCDLVMKQSAQSLEVIPGISKRRIETLPFAAQVLRAVIKRAGIDSVFVSAAGVREGVLYERLSADERTEDPLLAGVQFFAKRFSPSPNVGPVVARTIESLFSTDSADAARIRRATCRLIDIGAFFHPDLRAYHAFDTALRAPFQGLRHEDRVTMAVALFTRHEGVKKPLPDDEMLQLLDEMERDHAVRLGLALRFAAAMAPKTSAGLVGCSLQSSGGEIVFTAPRDKEILLNDSARRRLDQLADAFELSARVEFVP